MFEGHDQAIHDIVAERRLVEPTALRGALEVHAGDGSSLAAALLELGLLDKPTLLRAVADHLGGEYLAEPPTELPGTVVALVDATTARAHGIAPVAADAASITLLAAEPFKPELVDDLAFVLGRSVRLAVADPADVRALVRRHYGEKQASLDQALGELRSAAEEAAPATADGADIEELARRTPVVRFVNQVLARAIRDGASDIHFEPFGQEFKVRCRIDGALRDLPPPPPRLALPVVSRLKVLGNLNIAERRLPQDGRIKLRLDGRAVDLRVATLPTQFGESIVLRVLDQASDRLEIGQLGLPPGMQSGVEETIRRPNGIFIVTGPTGSGKTTTLYSCLKTLNTIDVKLLTVEDPVEYAIDGVMQVPVNLAAGLTFARALRTFLRQDPDVIMVGEIRDLETAQIAIQAALTGHLVLSTLHTNDAPGAVTRLVEMGIEPFLLASTLEAVLAQRLVRRICPSCKAGRPPDASMLPQFGFDPADWQDRVFHAGSGCSACGHTGYRGRLGIFEYLRMTDPLRDLVVRGASLAELRQKAIGEGMTTLRSAGQQAVLAGETTVEEVIKYT